MDFDIRQVNLKEFSVVTQLIHKTLQEDFPYKKETITSYIKVFNDQYFFNVMSHEKNVVFGAYKKEKLFGVIVLKSEMGGVVYVDWLAVKKGSRKEGIGSALLEKTDEWALEHKNHYLYLYTETDKNIDFYKKRGFTYVGKHENSWFGETEHVLGKQLRDKPFPEAFV